MRAQVHELTGDVLPANMPGAFYFSRTQPLGVVAGIAPWNAPLILSLRAVSLPLACGNTVVLKPAPDCPISGGTMLAEPFEAAGFPKGVVNLVTHGVEANREVGDEFVENRAVRCISFTGSTAVGRELAEKCGRQLKRIALELGGHNPLIVLSDASPRAANLQLTTPSHDRRSSGRAMTPGADSGRFGRFDVTTTLGRSTGRLIGGRRACCARNMVAISR